MKKRGEPAITVPGWRVARSRNLNERIGLPIRETRSDELRVLGVEEADLLEQIKNLTTRLGRVRGRKRAAERQIRADGKRVPVAVSVAASVDDHTALGSVLDGRHGV